jgi:hypothetical protein
MDIFAEGEIAGTSDGKIRGREITSRTSNPFDAVRNGVTPGELLGVIDAVKQQAFSVPREALAGISEGLYRITDARR